MFNINIDNDLQLREIQMTDASHIFQIIDNERNYLQQWLPFVCFTKTIDDTESFIKNVLDETNVNREIVCAILYNKQIAGLISFKNIDRANHKTEIGYWLSESKQGRGLVTKACSKLVDLAFNTMALNRVQIRVGVNNIKSKAIPRRLGFKFEGIERAGELLNGTYLDLEVYSMLKNDWVALHLK
jgi:ribosomal-protein-serine acetyltransferase